MKTKIGISLLACTLILSSSPLPLVLADELSENNTTETLTNQIENELPVNQDIPAETQATTQAETLPPESEPVEEAVQTTTTEEEAIVQESYGEYELNELLQQEQRDAAMALMDAAPAENSRQKRSAMAYASNPQADFINSVAPGAVAMAEKYNLYASVMIAQAILESGWGRSALSLPPNHNLFGIKGEHNGQSVTMKTWEVVNGQTIWIDAKFRKYPNYQASLEDNAKLLRYGLNYDPNFYSGTWKEKTTSYKDATAWLTGRYATDPDYARKLNATIEANQLTKYDHGPLNPNDQTIKSNVAVNKGMKVKSSGYYIYTAPYNTSGSFRSGQLKSFYGNGARVEVTNLVTTSQGIKTYYIKNVGWVDHRALTDFATIKSQTPLNKSMRIAKTNYYIYNLPYNTDGATRVAQLANKFSVNQEVKVTSEATTSEGVKIVYLDKVGWVDYRAVKDHATITKQTTVNKKMAVVKNNFFIYSRPYNTEGATRGSRLSSKYPLNSKVTVTAEATTNEGVSIVYIDKVGWVDSTAVVNYYAKVTSQTPLNKTMRINKTNYFIYTKPYNTEGSERVVRVADKYSLNDEVKVTSEATTDEGVKIIHIDKVGWVDYRGFKDVATITKQTSLNQTMKINKTNYFIYNKPYNTAGAKRDKRLSAKYSVGQKVTVTAEATTNEGVYVKHIDKVGWVDARALK